MYTDKDDNQNDDNNNNKQDKSRNPIPSNFEGLDLVQNENTPNLPECVQTHCLMPLPSMPAEGFSNQTQPIFAQRARLEHLPNHRHQTNLEVLLQEQLHRQNQLQSQNKFWQKRRKSIEESLQTHEYSQQMLQYDQPLQEGSEQKQISVYRPEIEIAKISQNTGIVNKELQLYEEQKKSKQNRPELQSISLAGPSSQKKIDQKPNKSKQKWLEMQQELYQKFAQEHELKKQREQLNLEQPGPSTYSTQHNSNKFLQCVNQKVEQIKLMQADLRRLQLRHDFEELYRLSQQRILSRWQFMEETDPKAKRPETNPNPESSKKKQKQTESNRSETQASTSSRSRIDQNEKKGNKNRSKQQNSQSQQATNKEIQNREHDELELQKIRAYLQIMRQRQKAPQAIPSTSSQNPQCTAEDLARPKPVPSVSTLSQIDRIEKQISQKWPKQRPHHQQQILRRDAEQLNSQQQAQEMQNLKFAPNPNHVLEQYILMQEKELLEGTARRIQQYMHELREDTIKQRQKTEQNQSESSGASGSKTQRVAKTLEEPSSQSQIDQKEKQVNQKRPKQRPHHDKQKFEKNESQKQDTDQQEYAQDSNRKMEQLKLLQNQHQLEQDKEFRQIARCLQEIQLAQRELINETKHSVFSRASVSGGQWRQYYEEESRPSRPETQTMPKMFQGPERYQRDWSKVRSYHWQNLRASEEEGNSQQQYVQNPQCSQGPNREGKQIECVAKEAERKINILEMIVIPGTATTLTESTTRTITRLPECGGLLTTSPRRRTTTTISFAQNTNYTLQQYYGKHPQQHQWQFRNPEEHQWFQPRHLCPEPQQWLQARHLYPEPQQWLQARHLYPEPQQWLQARQLCPEPQQWLQARHLYPEQQLEPQLYLDGQSDLPELDVQSILQELGLETDDQECETAAELMKWFIERMSPTTETSETTSPKEIIPTTESETATTSFEGEQNDPQGLWSTQEQFGEMQLEQCQNRPLHPEQEEEEKLQQQDLEEQNAPKSQKDQEPPSDLEQPKDVQEQ